LPTRHPRTEIVIRRKLDDKIEIAAHAVEAAGCSGPKEFKLLNAETSAEFSDGCLFFFYGSNHARQFKIDVSETSSRLRASSSFMAVHEVRREDDFARIEQRGIFLRAGGLQERPRNVAAQNAKHS